MTETPKTLEVYRDSRSRARCRGKSCGEWITWYVLAASSKRMCFDGDPAPIGESRHDLADREIVALPFEANHWATCPNAKEFGKR